MKSVFRYKKIFWNDCDNILHISNITLKESLDNDIVVYKKYKEENFIMLLLGYNIISMNCAFSF